jgi:hypothetical protein
MAQQLVKPGTAAAPSRAAARLAPHTPSPAIVSSLARFASMAEQLVKPGTAAAPFRAAARLAPHTPSPAIVSSFTRARASYCRALRLLLCLPRNFRLDLPSCSSGSGSSGATHAWEKGPPPTSEAGTGQAAADSIVFSASPHAPPGAPLPSVRMLRWATGQHISRCRKNCGSYVPVGTAVPSRVLSPPDATTALLTCTVMPSVPCTTSTWEGAAARMFQRRGRSQAGGAHGLGAG